MHDVWRRIASVTALVLFLAAAASGQQLATLNVSVTDQSGGAIPNAQITIQSAATGAKRNDTSNADGLASLPGLHAGSYKLLVSAAEFGQYQSESHAYCGADCVGFGSPRCARAAGRSDGQGDSRYGADRGGILHVQPLRGWTRNVATTHAEIYREIGQQTSKLGYVGRDYKKPLAAVAAKQGGSNG